MKFPICSKVCERWRHRRRIWWDSKTDSIVWMGEGLKFGVFRAETFSEGMPAFLLLVGLKIFRLFSFAEADGESAPQDRARSGKSPARGKA